MKARRRWERETFMYNGTSALATHHDIDIDSDATFQPTLCIEEASKYKWRVRLRHFCPFCGRLLMTNNFVTRGYPEEMRSVRSVCRRDSNNENDQTMRKF